MTANSSFGGSMRVSLVGLVGGGLLFVIGSAAAEVARPSVGLVYNTKEWASLNYECLGNTDGTMTCEFTQVGVRKEGVPAETEKAWKELESEPLEPMSAKECAERKEYVDVLEGRAKPPASFQAPRSEREKRDLLEMLKLGEAYCKAPSQDILRQLTTVQRRKADSTCLVRSNHFTQTFARVDASGGSEAWVVKSEPEGACGVVQLSRFEAKRPFDGKIIFWDYVARKAVTNPGATQFPGLSCKDMDEHTYTYTWDTQYAENVADCEFIEFSVF